MQPSNIEKLLFDGFVLSSNKIREVLDGDMYSLINAFEWALSEQGAKHWDKRFTGGETLTKEDEQWLQDLMAMAMLLGK